MVRTPKYVFPWFKCSVRRVYLQRWSERRGYRGSTPLQQRLHFRWTLNRTAEIRWIDTIWIYRVQYPSSNFNRIWTDSNLVVGYLRSIVCSWSVLLWRDVERDTLAIPRRVLSWSRKRRMARRQTTNGVQVSVEWWHCNSKSVPQRQPSRSTIILDRSFKCYTTCKFLEHPTESR